MTSMHVLSGVPFDIGTSNRSGARHGPRQIRAESTLLRPCNLATRAAPFDSFNVADIGDVATNAFNLEESIAIIERTFDEIVATGCRPLAIGGDHTITLPILRSMHRCHGRLGIVHIDTHGDVADSIFGERITHGSWMRRAVEEDLVDPERVVQIGTRGTGHVVEDVDWPRQKGFRVIPAEKCWHQSFAPLTEGIRETVTGGPVYVSFDIGGLDPAFAPGTGTPEFGGLTTMQALEIIRGCCGLDIVGYDVVEVSPPYDPSGNTALLGANLLFELLCVLPGVQRR